ncbi:peroxisomal membrane protein PMP34-like isoform X1 [Babylonia areolata]|uniref:peroxisomal membrane protein PMP34-like isoform X1 n=1 Tax=Babylonia areolata TaxID=304850 RepID=UPI003FD36EE6
MHRSSGSTHLFLSDSQPFLRKLTSSLATVLGAGVGKSDAMKVVAALTSAQAEGERVAPGLFSYSNLVHAVSGAVGSVIAITVFYPLDTVRTRLQVDDHRRAKHTHETIADIVREEGVRGLYRGWLSMAFTIWVSYFLYFLIYHGLQSALFTFDLEPDPLTDLVIGFIAGLVNVFLTTPLWVANTRLKLQGAKLHTKAYDKVTSKRYEGIIDCLQKMIQAEGVWSLWNGTGPSVLLAANPAIQFMVYESLKRYFQQFFHTTELSGLVYFVIGAIAKAIATTATYPLQLIQSRLRAGYSKAETTQSLMQNILYLVRQKGVGALYKGMEAKLVQTVLTAALMFVAYEKIAAVTFRLMGLQTPASRA